MSTIEFRLLVDLETSEFIRGVITDGKRLWMSDNPTTHLENFLEAVKENNLDITKFTLNKLPKSEIIPANQFHPCEKSFSDWMQKFNVEIKA